MSSTRKTTEHPNSPKKLPHEGAEAAEAAQHEAAGAAQHEAAEVAPWYEAAEAAEAAEVAAAAAEVAGPAGLGRLWAGSLSANNGRTQADENTIIGDVRFGSKADMTAMKSARPSSSHSMTSSTMVITPAGIVSSSAFAALRLSTNSNFVGCSTGRLAGFSPLTMRAA